MSIKTFKTGSVGRWIGIAYAFERRKIGIGFWFFVVEIYLLKKASEK